MRPAPPAAASVAAVLVLLGLTGCTPPPEAAAFDAAARVPDACAGRTVAPGRGIAYADTVRALVVFVRFRDDASEGPEWPVPAGRPGAPEPLPAWGASLVVSDPALVSALPPSHPSLSAYFFYQSRNGPRGPHLFVGDIWPRAPDGTPRVHVTARPNRAYFAYTPDGRQQAEGGLGYLTREVLDALVADPRFDIGPFDANCDGELDHLMLVLRRDEVIFNRQGWAYLGGLGHLAGRPPRVLRYFSPSRRDSIAVDWDRSGQQSFVGAEPAYDLLIHEYGHRLFDMPGHTAMIRDNDVPLVALDGQTPSATLQGCAYNRMCGTGGSGSYDHIAETLSGHEMRRMGWAARTVLRPAEGDRAGVVLRDLYRHGEVVLVPLGPGAAGDTLSLEYRARTNFFDARRLHTYPDPFYGTVVRGLGAWGLLVTLTRGDPAGPAFAYAYDVLYADNTFRRVTRCTGTSPNCYADPFSSGLYHPRRATQLSPWTRPSVSGFTRLPPGRTPSGRAPDWFAIDGLRFRPGDPDSALVFDFVADVRRGFTVRRESWMGRETSGETLAGPLVVAAGATLTVEAGATVTFAAGAVVEAGATLVVENGATLLFGTGEALRVDGRLHASRARLAPSARGGAWRGIVRGAGAEVLLGGSRVEGVR
ncbi:MAG: hypothetical protein ACK41D_02705 [Rubricoccaceae bacterium]